MKNIFFLLFIFCFTINAQQIATDTLETQNLEEVIVSSVRAKENLPIAFNNISKAELSKRNLGQDIPILLNFLPNVVPLQMLGLVLDIQESELEELIHNQQMLQ